MGLYAIFLATSEAEFWQILSERLFLEILYSKQSEQSRANIEWYVARNILRLMPWLKANKWEGGYFWNSGFWNPAYDIRSVNDIDFYNRYLDRQKYSSTRQTILSSY